MVFELFKRRRRNKLRAQPVPDAWRRIAERNVAIYRRLPPALQEELLEHVQVFVAEKHFEGCGGLELTDEMRVTIAAQACVLLLNRETDYFPQLISILVYPTGYTVHDEHHVGDGIWEEGDEDLLGHTADDLGALVLSWDSARRGGARALDGENLVLHEFAHQLDFEDGGGDGTPSLDTRAAYHSWIETMRAEFEALKAAEEAGEETVIDTYGTTDPSEFFAVATEAFFERPHDVKEFHPALYAELKRFYRQDPVTYGSSATDGA